jgi:hypothetical protein
MWVRYRKGGVIPHGRRRSRAMNLRLRNAQVMITRFLMLYHHEHDTLFKPNECILDNANNRIFRRPNLSIHHPVPHKHCSRSAATAACCSQFRSTQTSMSLRRYSQAVASRPSRDGSRFLYHNRDMASLNSRFQLHLASLVAILTNGE